MNRNFLIASLLLFATGVLTSPSAMGSCGDWLAHPQEVGGDERPAAPTDEASEAGTEIPPRPCDGPLCRRSSDVPLPTPSAPTTHRLQCDAVTAGITAWHLEGTVDWLQRRQRLCLAFGHALRIDRPPQQG